MRAAVLFDFCDEGRMSGISGGRCGRGDETEWGQGDFRYFVRRGLMRKKAVLEPVLGQESCSGKDLQRAKVIDATIQRVLYVWS